MLHITVEQIQKALESDLPGSNAHAQMLPEKRDLIPASNHSKIKQSAVLIPLFYENDELKIIFTERNRRLKHHPGQISFPGGKCDPKDPDPLQTALRECEEEIGISPEQIQILGKLSELYISVSNFNIHPYLGFIAKKPKLILNRDEVENVIEIQLKSLFDSRHRIKQMVQTKHGAIEVPCFKIDDHIIWGATSMLIAELVTTLKKHYPHQEAH